MTRLVLARTPRPATRSGSRQVHSEREKQIMSKKELLKKVYEASSAETARYLTDDFQATFANGNPSMDKDTWIGSGVLMEAAMPDMVWEFDYIGEDGDDVLVDTRMSGTFENDLDLSSDKTKGARGFSDSVVPDSQAQHLVKRSVVRTVPAVKEGGYLA